jgi:hypothetical protein
MAFHLDAFGMFTADDFLQISSTMDFQIFETIELESEDHFSVFSDPIGVLG